MMIRGVELKKLYKFVSS